ncbi:MAG: adenylosuccinate lyase, partial [Methanobacterium sp.]
KVLNNLVFYPENIEKNLNATNGLIMAERFMAELTRKGMGRQTAYSIVRKCSLEANKNNIGLLDVVLRDDEIRKFLSEDDINELMDPHTYIGSSVKIVNDVLEASKGWF